MQTKQQDINLKKEILKIIRGARNGFYYGGKVRFMHSLVMAVLFSKKTFFKELKNILNLTLTHASKLAAFVAIYKTILLTCKLIDNKSEKHHSFIAGFLGGYLVFKNDKNPINVQILLYLLSRDIMGFVNLQKKKKKIPNWNYFSIASILSWGLIMYLYQIRPDVLQKSMTKSMDFLYKSSERIGTWIDYIPFYIPPKLANKIYLKFVQILIKYQIIKKNNLMFNFFLIYNELLS